MKNKTFLPLHIAKLLVGYFQYTLTEQERDELDDWICESDNNMQIFGACLEVSLRPKISDPDMDAEDQLEFMSDIFIKYVKKTITDKENKQLDDWLNLSPYNKAVFYEMPQTDNMDIIYRWLIGKWKEAHCKIGLN